jgi:hypothetical protein
LPEGHLNNNLQAFYQGFAAKATNGGGMKVPLAAILKPFSEEGAQDPAGPIKAMRLSAR